ncbi:MAG: imidazole glycerol phosphate synthase subunit HisH [Actinomycetota bacterium]
MRVAVLDYGMGNLRSVAKALEAAGAEVVVTSDSTDIDCSGALCVPGQGVFGRCIANLEGAGQDELVRTWIGDERPYLGICLGMQILFERSEEDETIDGLGILSGEVRRLTGDVRVPHMGWNQVSSARDGSGGEYYYFDHSYAAFTSDEKVVSGWCEHGQAFVAAIQREEVTAVQFHPEKSGASGIALLEKWLESASKGKR